ncbi:MAG: cupin domain-containing protein [Flavobacteriales bacterium]|nr:cupin domain-containing protein [Flavobacteriales bacterium]
MSAFVRLTVLLCLSFTGLGLKAQTDVWDGAKRTAPQDYDNIHVERIHSDERSSTFLIWVKKEVKLHKHEYHTETIVVLEGKAIMQIGDETRTISKGDLILIPVNTPHSVRTLSGKALKVVSVQAPEFKGQDRVWIDK